jgi:hypothetical protein
LGARKAIAFLGITLLLLLALLEGTWRLACALGLTVPPSGDRSQQQEWEWVRNHQRGELLFEDSMFDYDPAIGWTPKRNFRSEKINTNSRGQRGLDEIPVERRSDKKRMLFIGDSYTFGFDVGDGESFAALLNKNHLPSWEIINWGVPAYGTDQMVLLYEREGIPYKPDVVVMGFYTRDLFRNNGWFRSYRKPMFRIENGQLALANSKIPSPTELLRLYAAGQIPMHPPGLYLVEYFQRLGDKLDRRGVTEDSGEWQVSAKILERFVQKTRSEGSQPFLLIIPHDEFLAKDGSATEDIARLLAAKARELNLPCLDLIPVLREKSTSDPHPLYSGHFTPWGNQVTAEALYAALRENNLVD